MNDANPGWQLAIMYLLMAVLPILVPAIVIACIVWALEVVAGWIMGPLEPEGER